MSFDWFGVEGHPDSGLNLREHLTALLKGGSADDIAGLAHRSRWACRRRTWRLEYRFLGRWSNCVLGELVFLLGRGEISHVCLGDPRSRLGLSIVSVLDLA